MSNGYRKVRVILSDVERRTRVVDAESGDELLVSDVQIVHGRSTKFSTVVILTFDTIGAEIVKEDAPPSAPESPFIGGGA